jgi:hypothetical protein
MTRSLARNDHAIPLSDFFATTYHNQESRYDAVFDGQTLKGWHVSAQTGHSRASQHQTGGRWVVEEGAIVGSQDIPGNGGILITDELFGDFEVVLKMNAVCSGHDGRRLGWMSRRECSRFS